MGLAHNFDYDDDGNPNVNNFHYDDDSNPNVSSRNIPAVERNSGTVSQELQTKTTTWDPHQPLPARTPTSVLEQLQKRKKIITDDMTSIV